MYIIGTRNGTQFSFSSTPVQHKTLLEAETERDRLARNNVGKVYIVVELISEASVNDLTVFSYKGGEIPYKKYRQEIESAYMKQGMIPAIKRFREITHETLAAAKYAVELIMDLPRGNPQHLTAMAHAIVNA